MKVIDVFTLLPLTHTLLYIALRIRAASLREQS